MMVMVKAGMCQCVLSQLERLKCVHKSNNPLIQNTNTIFAPCLCKSVEHAAMITTAPIYY